MNDLRAIGKGKWGGPREVKKHPTKDFRRVPVKKLMTRLGVSRYEAEAEYKKLDIQPQKVLIPLKQHVGVPAMPIVKEGDVVKKGQLIAQVPADQLGANIHSSIAGHVSSIQNDMIVVEA